MAAGSAIGTIESVTGQIDAETVTSALAHEHLFVDFHGPTHPDYGRVDREAVRSECERRLEVVGDAGVDLLVDCTCIGIGRDVVLQRNVSRSIGIRIACVTGIYKALWPPELRSATVDELADRFIRELTVGIDDTDVRAACIKLATTEVGPTPDETLIHRAGAMAAAATGSAIVLHSPQAGVAALVLETLEAEGFDSSRLVWAHAQGSTPEENLELAGRGVTVSLDAIGTSDDTDMLDRIERLTEAGFGDRVVVSSDTSIVVHPADMAYERDIGYLHRAFAPKVEARFGRERLRTLLGANVTHAVAVRSPTPRA